MGEGPARARQEQNPDERLAIVCHHSIRSMNIAVWHGNRGFDQAQSLRGDDGWPVLIGHAVAVTDASILDPDPYQLV